MGLLTNVKIFFTVLVIFLALFYIFYWEGPYLFDNQTIPVEWKNTGTGQIIDLVGSGVIRIPGLCGNSGDNSKKNLGSPGTGERSSRLENSGEFLFLGGGKGQPDVILGYNKRLGKIVPLIKIKKPENLATHCVAIGNILTNTPYEDIVVGRTDGVYILHQVKPGVFKTQKIWSASKRQLPSSVSLGDYNHSGRLSIYVGNYIQGKFFQGLIFTEKGSQRNVLLQHTVDGKFKDVTEKAGVPGTRNTWTASFVDLNRSGYPDLVVANDEGCNIIYKNKQDGTFEKFEIPHTGFWMSLAVGDYNNNGYPSLFFTNVGDSIEGISGILMRYTSSWRGGRGPPENYTVKHLLVKNLGNYKFDYILSGKPNPSSGSVVLPGYAPFGWGAIFTDLELTGNLDLVYATGWRMLPWHRLKLLRDSGVVWINTGPEPDFGSRSEKGSDEYVFKQIRKFKNREYCQTPLAVDFDGDGIKELVWINHNAAPVVYKTTDPETARFINVDVPRNAGTAQANVVLKLDNGQQYSRQVTLGGTGLSASESSLFQFGIPSGSLPKHVTVYFSDGTYLRKSDLSLGETVKF